MATGLQRSSRRAGAWLGRVVEWLGRLVVGGGLRPGDVRREREIGVRRRLRNRWGAGDGEGVVMTRWRGVVEAGLRVRGWLRRALGFGGGLKRWAERRSGLQRSLGTEYRKQPCNFFPAKCGNRQYSWEKAPTGFAGFSWFPIFPVKMISDRDIRSTVLVGTGFSYFHPYW
uniref:Uncharacterized protein n=1 Tax=Setaria viridis TaxID=4556 RepID=A0A4U6SSY3_SETVI|nr:hypothetical protein SEVIR_9G085500v2 [Setaria viridis]